MKSRNEPLFRDLPEDRVASSVVNDVQDKTFHHTRLELHLGRYICRQTITSTKI